MSTYEATCNKCGSTFCPDADDIIDVHHPDGTYVEVAEHYADEYGRECGGFGQVLGAWGGVA